MSRGKRVDTICNGRGVAGMGVGRDWKIWKIRRLKDYGLRIAD